MNPSQTQSLTKAEVVLIAERVADAHTRHQVMPLLTDEFPAMTVADAYRVQNELRRCWVASGNRLIGWKIGLTSKAKMLQMKVYEPAIGFLTHDMSRPENSSIETADLIHPRVECEIAFVTNKILYGPACTRDDVLAATDFVLPAVEIIDSRFAAYKFDLPSVIADNSSSARFVQPAGHQ